MKDSIKDLEVYKGDGLVKKSSEDNLYEILKSLPDPDVKMKLTASQKYWWFFFGVEFLSTKQISKLDLIHLQDAAVAMDLKCKIIKVINDKNKASDNGIGGVVQKFPSGATNITGYQSALKDCIKMLDEISSHFGLSIKDRQKLKVEKADDGQLSLFEKFMQQKTS